MARPRKKAADRRGVVFPVRLTKGERAILSRAARAKGIPITQFVREAALRSAVRTRR